MKIERTKNTVRNVYTGIFLKIYQMIGPFILRTIMIHTLGMNYLGLNSLFTSVLQVLNLAELGVGSAMVYSMYKPIIEDDEEKICALMNLYKLYYRIIGLVILVIGCIITPFIPKLISGDVPSEINVYVLYLLNLVATVLSYWLFAYKNSLLTAHQRLDIINKMTMIITTIQYIFQMVVLLIFKNYYLYIIIALVSQALLNISTSIVADKIYPKYRAKGKLDKESVGHINKRVKDLFTSKIGEIIVTSADTIVISSFLGLRMLATYNNYYYIISSIMAFVNILFTATTAGIGNSLIVESKEKNYNDLLNFTFIISWISCFCATSLLCIFQPFMELWVGAENILPFGCVICFVVFFYIREINQLLNVFKDAAGVWHKDKYRPLATAMLNLVLNLILVKYIGIYGIILSTIISIAILGFPWLIKNLFTLVFEKGLKKYIIILIKYAILTIVSCTCTFLICSLYNGNLIKSIIIRIILCIIIPNILYILVFYKKSEFKYTIQLIDNIIGKRIRLLHNLLVKVLE